MIKFHYHTARRDIPRLEIRRGDRLCHVYSDTSLEELQDWGREHGLRPEWIDGGAIPHFDAFGEHIEKCGPGVGFRELAGDIRRWRATHETAAAGDSRRVRAEGA